MGKGIVVVGGGVSGLSAAVELSQHFTVTLLEARERLGGRIHTVHSAKGLPIELGAEFIHGNAPQTQRFLRAARLETHEVPDRHWKLEVGTLLELPDFWEQLEAVTGEIKPRKQDTSFAHFLAGRRAPKESVELAKRFVEGFHAAPLGDASIQGLRLSEESSEKIDGQRQLRISDGYDQLVNYLEGLCRERGVVIRTGAPVASIDWSVRPVSIRMNDANQSEITADAVILTLPLGVLKSGEVSITPRPSSKFEAVQALEMGHVAKVVLHFRERFWPVKNFGFIHTAQEWFDTWWADERGDTITAWAGGPKGQNLNAYDGGFVTQRALEEISVVFSERLPRVREVLIKAHTHNWSGDRFARGAYSFIPVNGIDACKELARPEEDRLFFAGEATDLDYQFGTVHGGIASGLRAARDLKEILK